MIENQATREGIVVRASATPSRALAERTAREHEGRSLVGAGPSNDEIGERLVIRPASARTHVSRTMGRLGARDRAQLVVFACEAGLLGER